MAEEIPSNFRNNIQKCSFNDTGYCKFKEECRKEHSKKVCGDKKCDRKCDKRHPKKCDFKERCKFYKKNCCAFSHEANAHDDEKVKTLENTVSELKVAIEKNKSEANNHTNDKVKSLELTVSKLKEAIAKDKVEESKTIKKLNSEVESLKNKNLELQQQFDKKQKDLEIYMKQEVHVLIERIETLKKSNENAFKDTAAKVKKDNESMKQEIEGLKYSIGNETLGSVEKLLQNKTNVTENKSTNENKNKPTKAKNAKEIKEEVEENIIKGFENDCDALLAVKQNCGFDLASENCKKCKYTTHSVGLLIRHTVNVHKIKETAENIISRFEIDIALYERLLETMEEDTAKFKCDQCGFATCSKGKLRMHIGISH